MVRYTALSLAVTSSLFVASCSSLPMLGTGGPAVTPSSPKIASLVSHVKCELWQAANSHDALDYYYDVNSLKKRSSYPSKETDPTKIKTLKLADGDVLNLRDFTISNIFREINYYALVEYTVDVTDIHGEDLAASFIHPYAAAATSMALSVNENLKETANRQFHFFQTVDLARFLAAIGKGEKDYPHVLARNPFTTEYEPPAHRDEDEGVDDCTVGNDLGGTLGLREFVGDSLVASAMSDSNPEEFAAKEFVVKDTPDYTGKNDTLGAADTTVRFTINAGIGGGPNWVITHFKGPTDGNTSPLTVSHEQYDEVKVTIFPVCLREGFAGRDKHITFADLQARAVVGSPFWANYLPPCSDNKKSQAVVSNKLGTIFQLRHTR